MVQKKKNVLRILYEGHNNRNLLIFLFHFEVVTDDFNSIKHSIIGAWQLIDPIKNFFFILIFSLHFYSMSFIIEDSRFSPSPFFWSRVHSCSHCVLIFFCCSCLLNETRQEKWSYYIPSLFVGPSSAPELYYFSCTKKYFLTGRTIFYFERKSNIVLPR